MPVNAAMVPSYEEVQRLRYYCQVEGSSPKAKMERGDIGYYGRRHCKK
jgi:hypothetical protein